MKILAVETSGPEVAFAALQIQGATRAEILAARSSKESRRLSREVIAHIDSVLAQAEWSPQQVDAVAVGLGPGSWTGLRIGLSTCKTLAQARGWSLAGVPTFDAMAQAVWRWTQHNEGLAGDKSGGSFDGTVLSQMPEHFLLLATAPCRPGEVYGKIYEFHPEYLTVAQPEWIGTPQMMADALSVEVMAREIEAPPVLIGHAAASVAAMLDERGQAPVIFSLPIEELVAEIGLAGATALQNDGEANPLELQPLYIAPSAAERNLVRI